TLGGAPVRGKKVWFEIGAADPGEFKENGKTKISAKTNENGEAIVTYLSPKRGDLSMSETVVIEAQLETGDPNWSHVRTEIVVNRGD
ncbi:MAG: hypothetical protein V3V48_07195, partial [Candidatus Aminicenantaceae bacterium]